MFNESQKNAFTTILRNIEEILQEIEFKLQHAGHHGILFGHRTDESLLNNKEGILKKINSIEGILKNLQQQFGLERKIVEVKRSMRGNLYYCLQALEDAKAKRMRGYGRVAEGLDSLIDPKISQIRQYIQEIIELIGA